MNRLEAAVTAIEKVDNLSIVAFVSGGEPLSMMSLDLDPRIRVGSQVVLTVKSSHVSVAKGVSGMLSTSNQLDATISAVNDGELLSSLVLRVGTFPLESIITRASSKRMQLCAGDRVTVLIKASDLSIAEVCDA